MPIPETMGYTYLFLNALIESSFYFIYVTGSKMMFSVFTMFAGFAEIAGLFIYPKMVHKFSRAMVYVAACVTPVVGLVLLWVTGYVLPQNVILTAAHKCSCTLFCIRHISCQIQSRSS